MAVTVSNECSWEAFGIPETFPLLHRF